LRGKPGFDHGGDIGQVSIAGKHRGDGLRLNPGQFTQHRYQPLEFQAIHRSPSMLEHNRNIRDSTAVAISA
jgi:hypothetical protein